MGPLARLAALGLVVFGCTTAVPVTEPGKARLSSAEDPCGPAGYASYSFEEAMLIPDGNPSGIRIGPLHTGTAGATVTAGGIIRDVVLSLRIKHSYTGDLEVRLGYDADVDGVVDVLIPVELYRARAGRCDIPEQAAYPYQLDGRYFFGDGRPGVADMPLAGGATASADPNADPGTPSFCSFAGLPAGGDFWLNVVDGAAGRSGSLNGWSVYLQCGDVPGVRVGADGAKALELARR